MLPSASSVHIRRGHTRHLLVALIFAAGCSGAGSCGSSCGGAVTSTLPDGGAFVYTGSKLDNTVQLRITQDGFNLLNADTLNQVIGGLNDAGSIASIPCFNPVNNGGCIDGVGENLSILLGDSNFDSQCDTNDATPLYISFKAVNWSLDPVNQILQAQLFVNIRSGDFYVRTGEAHSTLAGRDANNNPIPFQGDVIIDDRNTSAGYTEIDLDLQFTRAPDGRLLIMPTQASLDNIIDKLDIVGSIAFSNVPGEPTRSIAPDPALPANNLGNIDGYDGCDTDTTPYLVLNSSGELNGAGWAGVVGTCDPNVNANQSIGCEIYAYVLQKLEGFLQTTFQTQIVNLIQQQLDNVVCVRPTNSAGVAVACSAGNPCPKDDNGAQETCNTTFGVCVAQGQSVTLADGGPSDLCEPVALAVQDQVNLSGLTQTVGFPAGTQLNIYAGLGGKTSADVIDDAGVQLSAVSGTQPASTVVPALCVPPTTFPPIDTNTIPPLNFDDPANQPDGGVGAYDVGIGLAAKMLNQASYDSFNAGVFCLQISNKTSSFVSTQLFKTLLPSLGLLTHGTDAPMAILLRPTLAPAVRVGRGTLTTDMSGNVVPDDPLITLTLPQMGFDFYAVIDERWVRLFTLQADVALPLGLRTFAGTGSDMLQPVLGSLSNVITNINSSNNVILAENPQVVTQLLGAIVQFAQPLLAGVLQPIVLPSVAGLQLQVEGIAGAEPESGNTADGYNHLAIWAGLTTCGGANQPACSNRTVHVQAELAGSEMPTADEIRGPEHKIPTAILQVSASGVEHGVAEFSYRIDGGLWTPWTRESRITIANEMFYVQGHHRIEVTARESGNDRSQDPNPAVVDFLSSYEPPTVSLVQLNDGRVVTRAKSVANTGDQLRYSYQVGGGSWSSEGEQRAFSASELNGEGLSVRVTDERGMSATTHFASNEEALLHAAHMQ